MVNGKKQQGNKTGKLDYETKNSKDYEKRIALKV
jgi:hypothetical protein